MQEKKEGLSYRGAAGEGRRSFWRMISGEIISEQKHVRIGTSHGPQDTETESLKNHPIQKNFNLFSV